MNSRREKLKLKKAWERKEKKMKRKRIKERSEREAMEKNLRCLNRGKIGEKRKEEGD